MRESIAHIVLWLFVINLGIAFGAGLYESRITVPQWLSFTPGSGYRWHPAAAERVRSWWLGAAGAALVDRLLTFAYFIPTMLKLMRGEARPEAATVAKAVQWVRFGYLHHAATLIAWLAALQAFALRHRYGA